MSRVAECYDEMPYENGALPWTHPDRMATIGTLFGLQPAEVEESRILEIGCAHGGNLLPLAASLPASEFVGIDLSAKQIENGQQLITTAGLTNIRLLQLDLMDLDESFGAFDFIICHGLYSWVAPSVQAGILELCTKRLQPHGLAIVSYNTLPGWHMRGVLGKMMRFHTRSIEEPSAAAKEAREFARFLCEAAPASNEVYKATLRKEYELIREAPGWYLHHDHLASENQPLYFHEFAEALSNHQLQYVGEARFPTMFAEQLNANIPAQLQQFANNAIEYEQYLDFVSNRSFRETIICRSELCVDRKVTLDRLERLHAATLLQPESRSTDPAEFASADGRRLRCSSSETQRLLVRLAEAWPGTLPVQSLLGAEESEESTVEWNCRESRQLAEFLLQGFASGMIELRTTPLGRPDNREEKPKSHAVNRALAKSAGLVVNARHKTISMNDLNRRIVPLLDGTRNREQLASELFSELNGITLTIGDANADPILASPALVRSLVDEQLDSLALQGVLQA